MIKTSNIRSFFCILLGILASCTNPSQNDMEITNPLCESFNNPSGIDEKAPRFSWNLQSETRGQKQTAWQILVASSLEKLNNDEAGVWNSGKIPSQQSLFIPYKGKALQSGTKYFWKARAWDKDGQPSQWCEPQHFVTGIMDTAEWKAQWITRYFPDDYEPEWEYGEWIGTSGDHMGEAFYRKSFVIEDFSNIQRAVLRVNGPEKSDVWVNDRLIKKCLHWRGMYEIDLDFVLKEGKNQLAIKSIDKSGNPPVLMASLFIETKDGVKEFIKTDKSWKAKAKTAPAEWYNRFFYDKDWEDALVVSNSQKSKGIDKGPRSIMLRKDFNLGDDIQQAIAHITGLGSYQLFINGRKVGDELLTPGWTEFDMKVEYQTYDVAPYLKKGNNTIGIMLGNSWWGFHLDNFSGVDTLLKAFMQLDITSTDNTKETIITDDSWKASPSPVMMNHIYHGEVYDFTKEEKGWATAGFDDQHWKKARVLDYHVPLVAHQAEPIKVTEEIKPVSITPTKHGSYIVDFGQNMAGWVSIKSPEKETEKIILHYAELQRPDGSINPDNLRSAKSMNKYILSGNETGYLEPHFTYHGFRWVEVQGYPETLDMDDITAKVIHTDLQVTGNFECSNELLNKIFQNELWTFRSNFYAVPTDCPQRDERLGWMADAGNIPQVACYFMKVDKYFDKWVYDMEDSQEKGGHMPDFSPAMGGNEYGSKMGAPGWADAAVKVPYTLYRFYGDTSIINNHYRAMKQHVDDMKARSKNNLYEQKGWGDWLAIEPSPTEPFGSAFYYYSTKKLAEMAKIIGKEKDAAYYDSLSKKIAHAYQEKHFNETSSTYTGNTQTMNVLPVSFGITPKEKQEAVIKNIVKDIEAHEDHFTTGFLGTTILFPELSRFGYDELVYKMVNQRDYPSWGRIIDEGATTITEAWNAYMGEDFASHNHFNLGSITEWFFSSLAGIQPDMENPGFKHFVIKPVILDDLDYVDADYQSLYGEIKVYWEKDEDNLTLDVSVPVNTTATVYIPSRENAQITEGETPVEEITEIQNIKKEPGYSVYLLGSGDYKFISKIN